jgi:hypothetical protein
MVVAGGAAGSYDNMVLIVLMPIAHAGRGPGRFSSLFSEERVSLQMPILSTDTRQSVDSLRKTLCKILPSEEGRPLATTI